MDKSKIISRVLQEFNRDYHETNPIGAIQNLLEKEGVVATTEFPVQHVDRGVTNKVYLNIEDHPNKVLVNLYRLDSGRYEVNAYEVVLLAPTKKRKPTNGM